MDSTSIGSVVIAVTGLVTGLGALWLNWRSQKDQTRQQAAASAMVKSKARLEETQQALDALRTALEIERETTTTPRVRNQHLEDSLDEERSLRHHLFSAQVSRCREVQGASSTRS